MPGIEVTEALSSAPNLERPFLKAHKALPRRRDATQNIRQIEIPPSGESGQSNGTAIALTPSLPLTPPNQSKEDSKTKTPDLRSYPSIPLNHDLAGQSVRSHQFSPPTPDTTPPRLRDTTPKARPSIFVHPSASSRAESFKTAREAFSSDEELETRDRSTQSPGVQKRQRPSPPKTSPLINGLRPDHVDSPASLGSQNAEQPQEFGSFDGAWVQSHEGQSATSPSFKSRRPRGSNTNRNFQGHDATEASDHQHNTALTRERSLRDRLHESQDTAASRSVEKFGEDIGWILPEREQRLMDRVDTWRLSGGSTTSTIEAVVIDSPPQIRRTLRHSEKRTSLRSVSSPNPQSTRTSLESTIQSQHRLVHRAGRITSRDRHSVASDMTVSTSATYNQLSQEPEVIPVIVIPERRSSLKSSASSSRNHSKARSQSAGRRPTAAPNGRIGAMDTPPRQKKRTMSDSIPSLSRFSDKDSRGRGFSRPSVPPRSSSLSAPTSRNNSRSTSLTSESLRRHTEAMDKVMQKQDTDTAAGHIPSPRIVLPDDHHGQAVVDHRSLHHDAEDAQRLRPPSLHFTQPSVVSSSPGPVEIGEATAMTFFPHHNGSLLLIDPHIQLESRAVQALRGRPLDVPFNAKTPEQSPPPVNVDSPLRNPRPPPKPPLFKVIPPTPMDELDRQLGMADGEEGRSRLSRGLGSIRRALGARRRSEPSAPFTLSQSTRSAKNRKTGKDIDSKLHPFWRPRGFWDDFGDSDDENGIDAGVPGDRGQGPRDEDDVFVNNSLGMPQTRVIFSGPLALARRISKSRGNRREQALRHQSSQANLRGSAVGPGITHTRSPYRRRVQFASKLGIRFLSLRDLQQRLRRARQLREEERWQARREKLKQSIGEKTLIDPYQFDHNQKASILKSRQ